MAYPPSRKTANATDDVRLGNTSHRTTRLPQDHANRRRRAAGSQTWAGLYNTYYWIDPAKGVAGVICTQSLPFADAGALECLWALERGVYGRSV